MLKNTRRPHLSLWQSAVDEVVSQTPGAGAQRPDAAAHPMVAAADADVDDVERAASLVGPSAPPPQAASATAQTLKYCSALARDIVTDVLARDPAGKNIDKAELTARMGACDPRWVEVMVKYAQFRASGQAVPYRVHGKIGDFVIDDGKALPAKACVAIVGDWGTGQDEARRVLAQIAAKKPDVVFHLGDIYYSCTTFEAQNYFYDIWSSVLNLEATRTFTLCGNHDVYGGGAPYYALLDRIDQPASYFCVRNARWQFLAIDTGLNDRTPDGTEPTYLQDTEVAWLTDKVRNAGGRRTVLLSHHQLFTAYEDIAKGSLNTRLQSQLAPILPSVDVWLWGHEHDLVIYNRYQNVLARCIGHGAFPVGIDVPHTVQFPEVPIAQCPALGKSGAFINHGYAIMDIDGDAATIAYYQDSDEEHPMFKETLLPATTA